jgi:hypothetical protein
MSRPSRLPADPEERWLAIRARLEPFAAELARQGGVTTRLAGCGRVASVRFIDRSAGKPIHRSIYLGSDLATVARVKRLLADWRLEGQLAAEAENFAKFAMRVCGALRGAIGRPRRGKGAAAGCRGSCSP